jgi:hypothetical protein
MEVSKMRKQKWVVALLALALAAGGSATAYAQPGAEAPAKVGYANKAGKAGKQGRAGKVGRAGKGARGAHGPLLQQEKMLEKALGAPLTEQQKRDIEAAHKTYMESVAKAVGLTPEQLQEKMKEARRAGRAEKGEKAPKQ